MADATVTPVNIFERLQVYDVDFGTGAVGTIIHSLDTNLLLISIVATSGTDGLVPSVTIIDDNSLTLTSTSSITARIFISVASQ